VNLGLRGPLTDAFMHARPTTGAGQYQQHSRWSGAQSQSCMLRVCEPQVVLCHVKPRPPPPSSSLPGDERPNLKHINRVVSSLVQGNTALSLEQTHVSVTLLQLKATVAVLSTALGPLSRPLPEVTQLVESIQFGDNHSRDSSSTSGGGSQYLNGTFLNGYRGEGAHDRDDDEGEFTAPAVKSLKVACIWNMHEEIVVFDTIRHLWRCQRANGCTF
jgi:hypothetical protein